MYKYTAVDFDPFADEREIEKIVSTNDSQREIWLACAFGGDEANLAYNESISVHFEGTLHLDEFSKALKNVVLRHEALRSTISANGETLIIYRDFPSPLQVIDISDLDVNTQKISIKQFIAEQLEIVMDLNQGPLFKVYLHHLSETQHHFTIIKHHVIADGWSSGIILEDLSKMYNAYIKGEQINLFKAAQLSDYGFAQRKFKSTNAYDDTEAYWLKLYSGQVPVVDLPTDFPRTTPRSYRGMRMDYPLSKDLLDQLKNKGAKAGASLVTTLLSAFEIFLYSKTRQQHLVIGLPASGQAASGLFDVVGHCVNLLPLKTTIETHLSFSEYLKKRKSEVLDAYDHQRLTFGELIKKLYIQRDSSRITLVPVIFNIDMGMDQLVSFHGLSHQLISNPRNYESFDLYLNATGSKNGVMLEWSFNTGLFSAATITGFHHDFKAILEKIIVNPSISIGELSNAAATVVPEHSFVQIDKNTVQLFKEAAHQFNQKTAVSFNHEYLTYADLDTKSDQMALFLLDQGVKKGDIIALSITRSIDMLVSLLGILKAGAAYLPLDPEYPKDRIEFMLGDSCATILLVSAVFKGTFKGSATEIIIEEIQTELSTYHKPLTDQEIKRSDLAYILYTSGSTGQPKGVQITHQNLANFLISMKEEPGITSKDTLLAITTISFDIAGLELYLPIISGAETVIADAEATRDGRLLIDILNSRPITIMQATPSTWQMLIDAGWKGSLGLKVLTGGEALSKQLADHLLVRAASVWNMYGPTETTIWSTLKQIQESDKLILIGKPILNTFIQILDEAGNEVRQGQIGEIVIGGDGVAKGYLNRAALNAEKFIQSGSGTGIGKVYRTGDLGKMLDHGDYQCLGRIDQQVKIRGHRIELGEIEAILTDQDDIKQSVVMAREDQPGDQRLIAYVILEQEAAEKNALSWRERWETLYSIGAEVNEKAADQAQDLDGTLLNYYENGADLALQSAEWLASSIDRIKKLGSRRIYEIGSGAGQILYELAPGIDQYVATDYSQTAIAKLNEKLSADPQRWAHVKAKVANADDFSHVKGGQFDLVLIHSVAQYFPDDEYLMNVIRNGIALLNGQGYIFIGDMQGKNTLEMCHAMDHLPKAADHVEISQLKKVVENRVRIDDELIADPDFFYALSKFIPEIAAVDIQLRKGQSINETTKYHYDVCLHIGKKPAMVSPEIGLSYHPEMVIADIEKLLYENPDQVIEVSNIFNSRTAKDYALLQLLHHADPSLKIEEVRSILSEAPSGLHPDLFWDLAEKFNFNAHISWSTDGSDGRFDAVFIPGALVGALPDLKHEADPLNIHDYCRVPYAGKDAQVSSALSALWVKNLNKLLPAYMVPEQFIALEKFPLTPNAKIDKKALPKPKNQQKIEVIAGKRPETSHEKLVAKIWTEVLGIDNLKVTDDFFQLGGHSLLAMKVMIAIEKETGKRLPLAIFFDNSTIQKIALQLADDEPYLKFDAIVPIKPSGSKSPIFLIHGGGLNVLLFKSISRYFDEEQPIYGIQALGLNKEIEVPDTLEEIAAKYIEEMILVDPTGPYALAGYSLGGFFAYEMAKQLKAMGKTVKMVGIIDTYASTGEKLNSSEQIMKKIKRQFHKVPFFINSFQKYPQETIAYQAKILKKKFNRLKSDESIADEEVFMNYEMSIYETYSKSLSKYDLLPQDQEITLFRVSKRLYYLDDQEYLGWNNYALQGVKVLKVPGDHRTFLVAPYDKAFVEILQAELDRG